MTEQEIVTELLTTAPEFLCEVSFSIIEERVSNDPLIQAIQKLDLNAQLRIFAAINSYF